MYSVRLEKFRQKKHLFSNDKNVNAWQWRHDSKHVVDVFSSPVKYNMFYVLVPDSDFDTNYWYEMMNEVKPCHAYIY